MLKLMILPMAETATHNTGADLGESLNLPLRIFHILEHLQRDLPDSAMDPFQYLHVHQAPQLGRSPNTVAILRQKACHALLLLGNAGGSLRTAAWLPGHRLANPVHPQEHL